MSGGFQAQSETISAHGKQIVGQLAALQRLAQPGLNLAPLLDRRIHAAQGF